MKREQLEDGRLTRRIHQPPPGGHWPSCHSLPVANGRAPPKDQTGSKKHKKSRSAHGQQKLPHGHRLPGRKTHFLPRQLTVTCVQVRREESIKQVLGRAWAGRPETARRKGDVRETSTCGSETEALSLSSTLDHRPTPVPQRQQDQQSWEEAEASLGFLWLFSIEECLETNIWWQKYSFLCIYCLHIDATFKGYRNGNGVQVWSV